MRFIPLLTTLSLFGCADEDKAETNDTSEPVEDTDTDSDTETDTDTGADTDTEEPDPLDVDDDGDGQTENQGDCDDTNADIYAEAEETCDGVDNNCNNQTNEENDTVERYFEKSKDNEIQILDVVDIVRFCFPTSNGLSLNSDREI